MLVLYVELQILAIFALLKQTGDGIFIKPLDCRRDFCWVEGTGGDWDEEGGGGGRTQNSSSVPVGTQPQPLDWGGGGGGGGEAEEKLEQPENFILRSSACWLLSTVSHCAAGFCVRPFVIQIQRSQHQARIDVSELACIEHRKRAGYKRMLNGLNIQIAAVLDFVFCDISFRSNGSPVLTLSSTTYDSDSTIRGFLSF